MTMQGARGARAEIDVTPLVDVVLVLLIIFMVLTPLSGGAHAVSLPEEGGARDDGGTLLLSIAPDLALELDGAPVARDGLPDALLRRLRSHPRTSLVLRSDASVSYQDVVKVIDVARQAGVTRIGIAPQSPGDEGTLGP